MKLSLLPLHNDDVIRIRCDGPISLRGSEPPGEPLQGLLGPHCFSLKVLLNLERAQGIDTSGVSWLVRDLNRFRAAKGKLVLYSVPPLVSSVLDFLHLISMFHMAANEVVAREVLLGESDLEEPAKTPWARDEPPNKSLPGRLSG